MNDISVLTEPPPPPEREKRVLMKESYRRTQRLAKELWLADIALAMVCMKCGEGLQKIGEVGVVLLCRCRERVVR